MTTNPPTLLLVEDEPDSVFFFKRSAQALGLPHPIQVAPDGQQAIDYLEGVGVFADRTLHPLPCLVLLDLKLPHASGFEVLQRIRQHPDTRALIVLVLTASASEEDISRAYALGANGYLVKPSHLEKLPDLLRAIRDYWLTHNYPSRPRAGTTRKKNL